MQVSKAAKQEIWDILDGICYDLDDIQKTLEKLQSRDVTKRHHELLGKASDHLSNVENEMSDIREDYDA